MQHGSARQTPGCTRRRFLSGAAGLAGTLMLGNRLGAASTMNVKIAKVEAFPVNYPTVGRFKFFEDLQGRPVGRQTVAVRITADDGSVGWGQSVPTHRWSYETLETVYTTITRYLAPTITGEDPFDIEGIHARMGRIIAPSFSTGQPICKAGIDLALHDLTAKLTGKPVAARWNRKGRDRLTISWTLNPKTLDDIPGLIEEGRQHGYKNFNVKVAPDPVFDVEMCKIVKRLVPDGFLWADANGGYDEATALAVAPKLAEAGAAVLEQPLPANRLTGYRKLKQLGAIPIIMDEGLVSSAELEEFIKLDLLDGVAMKPARCAGLLDASKQIEMALDQGLMFLGSGLTDPDVSLAASLILYGAYDLKYPAALNGPQFLATRTILKQPLTAVGGEMSVPTGPGLGVEVDEDKVREYAVKDLCG